MPILKVDLGGLDALITRDVGLSYGLPHELLVTALLRARMTQSLGPTFGEADEEGLSTVGLFSVIDAIMDAPMTRVLESLPFSDEVMRALLEHEGPKGEALHCVLACERGDVEEARRGAAADAMLGSLYP